jgi:hypothetical protein
MRLTGDEAAAAAKGASLLFAGAPDCLENELSLAEAKRACA